MLILAIDTATRRTGIALGNRNEILAERSWIGDRRQTSELAPAIEMLFNEAGSTIDQLNGIAVAIGPGSYTGLRIGLGVAKGIVLVHSVPLVAVQTHDIGAADIVQRPEPLLVTVEAGRKRMLVARYAWSEEAHWRQEGEIKNHSLEELTQYIQNLKQPVTIAGEISADWRDQLSTNPSLAAFPVTILDDEAGIRQPSVLLRLGETKIKRGEIEDPHSLTPLYLRNPDGS